MKAHSRDALFLKGEDLPHYLTFLSCWLKPFHKVCPILEHSGMVLLVILKALFLVRRQLCCSLFPARSRNRLDIFFIDKLLHTVCPGVLNGIIISLALDP